MSHSRYLGLDIMRAMAISMVLLCHYSSPLYPFVSGIGERLFNIMNWLSGYFGVEFFFVLSGFLIGRIYLSSIHHATGGINKTLSTFVKRRWWRTLPNYYLFVLVNILIIFLLGGAPEINAVTKAILFLQKMRPEENVRFYGVSWSLAVEEWFYILLPLSFFVFIRVFGNKSRALKLSVGFLLFVPTLLKVIYCCSTPVWADHEEVFRYATLFRLDSIFSGVVYAWIWQKENIRMRLLANRVKIMQAGLLLLFVCFAYGYLFLAKPIQNSLLYAFYTPINCLAIGMFIPYLMGLKSDKFSSGSSAIITFLSTTSYSVYLSHVPVKQLCDYYLRPYFSEQSLILSALYIVLMLSISFAVSALIYKKFELKLLQYRDKVLQ